MTSSVLSPLWANLESSKPLNALWEIIRGLGFHPLKQLHALIYGKFTPRYLWTLDKLGARLPQKVKDYLADTHHGKVLKLEDAIKIVSHDEGIEMYDLEKVIPYKHARDIILRSIIPLFRWD